MEPCQNTRKKEAKRHLFRQPENDIALAQKGGRVIHEATSYGKDWLVRSCGMAENSSGQGPFPSNPI